MTRRQKRKCFFFDCACEIGKLIEKIDRGFERERNIKAEKAFSFFRNSRAFLSFLITKLLLFQATFWSIQISFAGIANVLWKFLLQIDKENNKKNRM